MEARLVDAGPVDGLILALHGALVVDQPDGDGEVIARMRAILPDGVPIGVSLDLHGHITPLMLQPCTFHIGYRTYPHIDMFETGERVASLMVRTLSGECRPVMALAKCPVLVPAVCGRTTDGPLAAVALAARAMGTEGAVLHASIFPVQPWIDVPDLGFAALVCANGDNAVAQAAADILAAMIMDARHDFSLDLVPLDEAIAIAHQSEGMTLVSDSGDAPTGGGGQRRSSACAAGRESGGAIPPYSADPLRPGRCRSGPQCGGRGGACPNFGPCVFHDRRHACCRLGHCLIGLGRPLRHAGRGRTGAAD